MYDGFVTTTPTGLVFFDAKTEYILQVYVGVYFFDLRVRYITQLAILGVDSSYINGKRKDHT